MRVLDGLNGWLNQVVISPDNKRILATDSKGTGIRQFDLSDGSLRQAYRHGVGVVCFYPDSDQILLALDGEVMYLNWEIGYREDVSPREDYPDMIPASRVDQMLVNPAGELVTLGLDRGYENYLVSRWKVGKGGGFKRVGELKLEAKDYSYAALSPDGSKLVAVYNEYSDNAGGAVIFSLPKFKEVGSFESPIESHKQQILMSPTGNQIVAREEGSKTFFTWAGPDWKECTRVAIGGRRNLTGLAYHPSGKCLAAACNDETVRVYDTTSLEEVSKFTWKSGRLRSVAYSPDGTLAAAGSDTGKVIVWDVDE